MQNHQLLSLYFMGLFKAVVVFVLVTAHVLMSSCTSDQGSTCCSACHVNYRLNNIQLLNEIIDNRVRSILQMANSTGKKKL